MRADPHGVLAHRVWSDGGVFAQVGVRQFIDSVIDELVDALDRRLGEQKVHVGFAAVHVQDVALDEAAKQVALGVAGGVALHAEDRPVRVLLVAGLVVGLPVDLGEEWREQPDGLIEGGFGHGIPTPKPRLGQPEQSVGGHDVAHDIVGCVIRPAGAGMFDPAAPTPQTRGEGLRAQAMMRQKVAVLSERVEDGVGDARGIE